MTNKLIHNFRLLINQCNEKNWQTKLTEMDEQLGQASHVSADLVSIYFMGNVSSKHISAPSFVGRSFTGPQFQTRNDAVIWQNPHQCDQSFLLDEFCFISFDACVSSIEKRVKDASSHSDFTTWLVRISFFEVENELKTQCRLEFYK
jgi:hypothetical protein